MRVHTKKLCIADFILVFLCKRRVYAVRKYRKGFGTQQTKPVKLSSRVWRTQVEVLVRENRPRDSVSTNQVRRFPNVMSTRSR